MYENNILFHCTHFGKNKLFGFTVLCFVIIIIQFSLGCHYTDSPLMLDFVVWILHRWVRHLLPCWYLFYLSMVCFWHIWRFHFYCNLIMSQGTISIVCLWNIWKFYFNCSNRIMSQGTISMFFLWHIWRFHFCCNLIMSQGTISI